MCDARQGFGTALIQDKIYVIGGYCGISKDTCENYNIIENRWE